MAVTLVIIILWPAGVTRHNYFINNFPFINFLIIFQITGSVTGRQGLSISAWGLLVIPALGDNNLYAFGLFNKCQPVQNLLGFIEHYRIIRGLAGNPFT